MDKILVFFGGAVVFLGGMLLLIPLGTLCGAIAGWIVGMFFPSILTTLAAFGVHGVTMWQFGAFLGFVGSFLKTKVDTKVKAAE